ncbi:metalloprotease TldD [Tistrella mobilis]|jgi:TldD protein|uniref:metalloprotease TldD n=1 Tax=Tistrella mobilis TaxID=171437 RepID=UPI0035578F65
MPDTAKLTATDPFFASGALDRSRLERQVAEALRGADDGELFLEYRQSEVLGFDDGHLRSATFDTVQGFGMRAVAGDTVAYAHASQIDDGALARAADTVGAVLRGHGGTLDLAPAKPGPALYQPGNPLDAMPFADKVKLLAEIDAWARARDNRVRQVSATLSANWQVVEILRPDGSSARDVRPLVRIGVSLLVGEGDRQESGYAGAGGRAGYTGWVAPERWQALVEEALSQALINLEAAPAPAGEMTVVLGSGWPGILLHEAVGHGLEGDFNRRRLSAFSGLIGERVAAPGVTVVDDGTIPDRRGSLTIDDEGTPSSRTVLIEDGILKGYMQDRMNARLMGVPVTGNGRRESYAHQPLPRMTNTYMLGGDKDPAEIIASVKRGLYAKEFGGGQVDITSGKFTFSASLAYLIEDGKITRPVKGATLIGNGPDVLKRVSMIGNDMALDGGIGSCGKDGQWVPVGVGQPTLRIDGLTVGGTEIAA